MFLSFHSLWCIFSFPLFFLFISLCHTGPSCLSLSRADITAIRLYSPHPHKAVHLY